MFFPAFLGLAIDFSPLPFPSPVPQCGGGVASPCRSEAGAATEMILLSGVPRDDYPVFVSRPLDVRPLTRRLHDAAKLVFPGSLFSSAVKASKFLKSFLDTVLSLAVPLGVCGC